MRQLELLAPARDLQIGIAAIDCGADAVYIAGPQFGARQAAGNEISDIKQLCDYAHKFGARIFITLNTILYDSELEDAYKFMLDVQEAGADAIIVQDMAVIAMASNGIGNIKEDIRLPLHAPPPDPTPQPCRLSLATFMDLGPQSSCKEPRTLPGQEDPRAPKS